MKGTKQNSCVGTKLAWLGRTGIRRECEFLKATSAAKDIAPETDRRTRCSMPANSIFAFQFERTVGVQGLFRGPVRGRGGRGAKAVRAAPGFRGRGPSSPAIVA